MGRSARRGGASSAAKPALSPPPPLFASRAPTLTRKPGLEARAVGAGAWVVPGCLTPAECGLVLAAAEARGYEHATSRGPRHGEAPRSHSRAAFLDPAFARALWDATGLRDALAGCGDERGPWAGLNPAMRAYRYDPGDVFGAHFDQSVRLDEFGAVTRLTFLCYLTGEGEGEGEGEGGGGGGVVSVVGGETAFFRDCREGARELFRVAPKRGDALVFVHGDACLPHASLEVRRGVKVVLRSDVF